jgi:hypothetical protein
MKDALAWIERLRKEAEECRLISKLATSMAKRDSFARLADETDKRADELAALVDSGQLSALSDDAQS